MKSIKQYFWILPVLIVITGLIIYPILWTIWLSFQSKTVGGTATFVGLSNYTSVNLINEFLESFSKSWIFTVPSIAFKLLIGMALALILNKEFKGRNILRAFFFVPWTIPKFAVAIIFIWLLGQGTNGGLDLMLNKLGIQPIYWLGPHLAMLSMVIINVWKGFPFFMVGILAALQAIPQDVYDAALIDGASTVQTFFYVTLPLIKNVVLIVSVLSTIWTVSEFAVIFVVTGGGPGNATNVLPVFTYLKAFKQYDLSGAATMAIFALPFLVGLIILLVKLTQKGSETA